MEFEDCKGGDIAWLGEGDIVSKAGMGGWRSMSGWYGKEKRDCQGVHDMWFMPAWNVRQDLCMAVHHPKQTVCLFTAQLSSVHRAKTAYDI